MRILLGLLLLPFCVAATRTLAFLVGTALPSSFGGVPLGTAWLLGGFLLWLILFLCLPRPVKSYVLAHELTHALWALVMGARVSGLKVSARGGRVKVSRTNFLITLAPYFFPLYTVLVIVAHGILAWFFNLRAYEPFWLALVGLTWGFHLTFTLSSLREHQPDIRECGRLFSLAVIWLFNVLGVGLWIVAVASPTLRGLAERLGADVGWTLGLCFDGLTCLWHQAAALVRTARR